MNINNVTISGRLTDFPELKQTKNGTDVVNMTVAVNRGDEANFLDVVVFGKQAENVSSFLEKGDMVGVTGRLSQNKWEDGNGNKRSDIEIIAHDVRFGPNNKDEYPSDHYNQDPVKDNNDEEEVDPDEIPF